MLNLHANVGGLIDCCARCGLLSHTNAHVQLKALIHLVLAILDAGDLGGALRRESVRVDAVEVTLAEEQGWQGCLLQSFAFVLGVLGPRSHRLSH